MIKNAELESIESILLKASESLGLSLQQSLHLFQEKHQRTIDIKNISIQDWEDLSEFLQIPFHFLQYGYNKRFHHQFTAYSKIYN